MKITEFIVCDDIRGEMGSKFSLMGIYANDIKFSNVPDEGWPIPFKLACFIRLENSSKPQEYNFELKVMLDGTELAKASSEAPSTEMLSVLSLPIVFPLVNIPGTGDLSLEFKLRAGKKVIIEESKVIKISNLKA